MILLSSRQSPTLPPRQRRGDRLPPELKAVAEIDVEMGPVSIEPAPDTHERLAVVAPIVCRITSASPPGAPLVVDTHSLLSRPA